MSATGAPQSGPPAERHRAAKMALGLASLIVSTFFLAFLVGLLTPFLLWLLAVAGLLGLLAFFLSLVVAIVFLVVFASRGLQAPRQERQSATIESLETRQP